VPSFVLLSEAASPWAAAGAVAGGIAPAVWFGAGIAPTPLAVEVDGVSGVSFRSVVWTGGSSG